MTPRVEKAVVGAPCDPRKVDLPWRVKQRQADEHLRRFADECADYVRDADVRLDYETDPATGTVRVLLHADAEPPASLGATIGDVLHNLRSALDAVAWAACQAAGAPEKRHKRIYFPIDTDPVNWSDTAKDKLPGIVEPAHLEVFCQLQPWYWDEQARNVGVAVPESAVDGHPLVRLNDLASVDRHRVPHPVLTRAGDTWLGIPEGAEVELKLVRGNPKPGEVAVEWRVSPPVVAASVDPAGDVILAMSEEGARHKRSALDELLSMRRAVVLATQRVEVEVLGVVTPEQIAELARLRQAQADTDDALQAFVLSAHVIDRDYIERRKSLGDVADAARTAYQDRSRELFD